jgi:hypothetical protein
MLPLLLERRRRLLTHRLPIILLLLQLLGDIVKYASQREDMNRTVCGITCRLFRSQEDCRRSMPLKSRYGPTAMEIACC